MGRKRSTKARVRRIKRKVIHRFKIRYKRSKCCK